MQVLDNGKIRLDFPLQGILSPTGDGSLFADTVSSLMERTTTIAAPLGIQGSARVDVQTPLGRLNLDGLRVTSNFDLSGEAEDGQQKESLQVSVDDFRLVEDFDNLTALEMANVFGEYGRVAVLQSKLATEIAITLTSTLALTIDFGKLTLLGALRYGNQDVGALEINTPFVLEPGDNQVRLRGYLWRTEANERQAQELIQAALAATPLRIGLEGVRLGYPVGTSSGEQEMLPAWVTKVAEGVKFDTTMTSLDSLTESIRGGELIESVETQDLYLRFDEVQDGAELSAIPMEGSFDVVINNPLGSSQDIVIESVAMSLSLVNGARNDAPVLGRIESPPVKTEDRRYVNGSDGSSRLAVTVPLSVPLVVDDLDTFVTFKQRIFDSVGEETSSGTVDVVRLVGRIDATVDTPLGRLQLGEVEIDRELSMGGSGDEGDAATSLFEMHNLTIEEFLFPSGSDTPIAPGFLQPQPQEGGPRSLQQSGESANGMVISVALTIRNPAPIGLGLADMQWIVQRDVGGTTQRIGDFRTMETNLAPAPKESRLEVRGMLQSPQGVDSEAFFGELVNALFGSDDMATIKIMPRSMRQRPPVWLTRVLSGVALSMPTTGILGGDSLVESVDASSLSLEPVGDDDVQLRGALVVRVRDPLGPDSRLDVQELAINGNLQGPNGKKIGVLRVPPQTAVLMNRETGVNTNHLNIRWEFEGTLKVEEDGKAFADLVKLLLSEDRPSAQQLTLQLVGAAAVTVGSILGTLPIGKMPLETILPLLGDDAGSIDLSSASLDKIQFGDPPPGRTGLGIVSTLDLALPESFPLSLNFGTTVFDVTHMPPGQNAIRSILGDISLKPLALKGGANKMAVVGSLVRPTTGSDRDALDSFVSQYIGGKPAALKLVGKSIRLEDTASWRASPEWLQQVAQAIEVDIDVVGDSGGAFGDVRVSDIGITARRGSDDSVNDAVMFEAIVRAGVESPLGPDLPITVQQVRVIMKLNQSDDLIGYADTGLVDVTTESSGGRQVAILSFKDTDLIFPDKGRAFGALAADLVGGKAKREGGLPLTVYGTVEASVMSDLGRIYVYDLPFRNEITLSGLGVGVDEGGLQNWGLSDASDGLQLDAAVNLQVGGAESVGRTGPLIAYMDIGTAKLDAYVDDKPLARLTAPNLRLSSGGNNLNIVGELTPGYTDLPTAASLMTSVVSGDDVAITLKGAEKDDSPTPYWVKQAISAIEMAISLKISLLTSTGMSFLRDVEIGGLVISFVGGDSPVLQGDVAVGLALPEGIDIFFDIIRVTLVTDLSRAFLPEMDGEPEDAPVQIGRLTVTTADLSAPEPLRFRAVFDDALLVVAESEESAFEDFLAAVFYDPGATRLYLAGQASIAVATNLGELNLDGININIDQDLKHLGGISDDSLAVGNVTVSGGRTDGLIMSTEIGLKGGASFGAELGDVRLDIYVGEKDLPERPRLFPPPMSAEGGSLAATPRAVEEAVPPAESGDTLVHVGEVTIYKLALLPGTEAKMSIDVRLFPTVSGDKAQGPRRVISQYVSGKDIAVVLKGSEGSTDVQLLKKALSRWESRIALGGGTAELMQGAELTMGALPAPGRPPDINSRLIVQNPFSVDLLLLYIDTTMFADGQEIGRTSLDWRSDPERIPAKTTKRTRPYKLGLGAITPPTVKLFLDAQRGEAFVATEGIVEAMIGEYRTVVDFRDDSIPVTIITD